MKLNSNTLHTIQNKVCIHITAANLFFLQTSFNTMNKDHLHQRSIQSPTAAYKQSTAPITQQGRTHTHTHQWALSHYSPLLDYPLPPSYSSITILISYTVPSRHQNNTQMFARPPNMHPPPLLDRLHLAKLWCTHHPALLGNQKRVDGVIKDVYLGCNIANSILFNTV